MLNKKAKSKNMFKKSISAVLASIMALSSGAAIATFNKTSADVSENAALKYFINNNLSKQVKIMMNGNNKLNINYWMCANFNSDPVNAGKYTAKLQFTIPGYNPKNLKFYIRDRSSAKSDDFVEYEFAGVLDHLYLTNLNPSSYEVHVYNGRLATENFVCKAEFSCILSEQLPFNVFGRNLINAVGEFILDTSAQPETPLELLWNKSKATYSNQLVLWLPIGVVPYNSLTVKVVFFAQESDRNDKNLKIEHILYDNAQIYGNYLYFVVDPQWGETATYEAHFYKDSVAPENFFCKAVNIPAS